MARKEYNWQRFWCPPDLSFRTDEEGYLADPDSPYGHLRNLDVVQLSDVAATSCLVLLGEPGTGKSHELSAAVADAQLLTENTSDCVLFFDLRAYQTDALLHSSIFDHPDFAQWLAGEHKLHLFLDSLDECLLRVDSVTALLEQELAKLPLDRLMLRVACRTADWRNSFEGALKELFQDTSVKVYGLVRLRRRDVECAAESEGLDSSGFLDAVKQKHAQSLATKPVTLRMLIGLYATHGALPGTQAQLYEKGIRLLCEESSEGRREIAASNPYDTRDIVACACRIAAATVLGNKYAVWTGINHGDVPAEDLAIEDIAHGKEPTGRQEVLVTQDLIRATLATGLFSSRGTHRMGWSHQTYAEFLAARYLSQNATSRGHAMQLLVHKGDPERRLPPQLHETAAWAATIFPWVFRRIMRRDPDVLLRSDVAGTEVSARKRLVRQLLALYDKEKLVDKFTDLRSCYAKLDHPGLVKQLQPYIRGKKKGYMARRAAIDIAEACELEAALPMLLAVALDQSDDKGARVNAAYGVVRIGDSGAKSRLKPLAMGNAGLDPSDDLKGCGLRAVWPEHITVSDLFQALTPPKRSLYGGSYAMFIIELRESLLEQLSTEDLQHALEWIARGQAEAYDFEELRENIILSSWGRLDGAHELAEPFAKVVLARLGRHQAIATGTKDCPFSQVICHDHTRRRLVLSAVVDLAASRTQVTASAIWGTPLATSEDLPWLAEQLDTAGPDKRQLWAELMASVFTSGASAHLDIVLDTCRRHASVTGAFPWLTPIVIDSPEGRLIKARYLKRRRLEKRLAAERDRPLLAPSPKERVLALLDEFEGGDAAAWWRMNREMTLEPDSQYYPPDFEWDLKKLPVWRDADGGMRDRIAQAARQYIVRPPEMDDSWLAESVLYRPACAGYRALAMVFTDDPTWVAALADEIWRIWAPIIVAYPFIEPEGQGLHAELASLACRHASDEIIRSLMTVVDREIARDGHVFVVRRFEHCWDDRLAEALMSKVLSPEMRPESLADLLDCLFRHHYGPAVEHALSLIVIPSPNPEHRVVALVAAGALLAHCPVTVWPRIWQGIQDDIAFGRELFKEFAHASRREKAITFAEQLSEDQVGDLYLWLAKQYPRKEDPQHEGAHSVGPRESVGDLRDALLDQLKVRGSQSACEQIRRIARELPAEKWMKWTLIEAEENARRKTWVPPVAAEVIAIAQDTRRQTALGVCSFVALWALFSRSVWLALDSAVAGVVISVGGVFVGMFLTVPRMRRWRRVLLIAAALMLEVLGLLTAAAWAHHRTGSLPAAIQPGPTAAQQQ